MSAITTAPFEARGIAEMVLRRWHRQATDAPTKAALIAITEDADGLNDLACQGLQSLPAGTVTAGGILPPGTLLALLNWFVSNGPALIAMILALFGVPVKA